MEDYEKYKAAPGGRFTQKINMKRTDRVKSSWNVFKTHLTTSNVFLSVLGCFESFEHIFNDLKHVLRSFRLEIRLFQMSSNEC